MAFDRTRGTLRARGQSAPTHLGIRSALKGYHGARESHYTTYRCVHGQAATQSQTKCSLFEAICLEAVTQESFRPLPRDED